MLIFFTLISFDWLKYKNHTTHIEKLNSKSNPNMKFFPSRFLLLKNFPVLLVALNNDFNIIHYILHFNIHF